MSAPASTPVITIKPALITLKKPTLTPAIHSSSLTRIDLPEDNSWIEVGSTLLPALMMDGPSFQRVWDLHPEQSARGMMFGKEIAFPRWTQSYGIPYHFSGKNHEAIPVDDPYLKALMNWVRADSGLDYNGMLVNWYKDGNHYIGPHSDDEKSLIKGAPIYSFSFGAERDFVITSKNKDLGYRKVISMPNGSLIKMCGDMQKYFKHEVPKRALSVCSTPRINITFRLFK